MFTWRGFPWTNFEELNLDWVLRHIKSIEVTQIPELAKKVDDTYQYITDNLGEIVSQLATVIYNVKWSGATGDGVTDDSAAIADALTKSNILYFPEGVYRFKNIDVEKPVIIFGDGDSSVFTPIRKLDTSNQFFTMFTFKDDLDLSNVKFKPLDPLPSESGTKYYNEAALVAELADHVHISQVTFDNFFEAYHISVADPVFIDFEDRHGMAGYIHNCGNVCIEDCTFLDYGGEELFWISQDRVRFASGNVKIHNNTFRDRDSTLTGSAMNILGGTIDFSNNSIINFNNIYADGISGGSVFNVMGAYTVFDNNLFKGVQAGNYLDFAEGYFIKSEDVAVTNNVFDGTTAHAIKIMSNKSLVKGNYFRGAESIRLTTTTGPTSYTTPGGQVFTIVPYCVDISTVYTAWTCAVITDNEFNIINAPYSLLSGGSKPVNASCISSQNQANLAAKFNYINILNNVFTYLGSATTDEATTGVIYFTCDIGVLHLMDNVFRGAGMSVPAYDSGGVDYKCILSGSKTIDRMFIQRNFINALAGAICIVTGGADFRTNSKYNMVFNSGVGTVLDHSGLTSSLGEFYSNYQDGITANT